MSTFLALTVFQTGDLASRAGLLAASGALQTQIDEGGGGGAPADANYVYLTGEQIISGEKHFIVDNPAVIGSFAIHCTSNLTGTNNMGAAGIVGSVNSTTLYDHNGTITSSRGVAVVRSFIQAEVDFTGNISNQALFYGDTSLSNTSTITNHRGLWLRDATYSGILNNYPIYISSQSGPVNNYSIFSQGGMNVFSGALGIGEVGTGAAPGLALHVGGATRLDVATTTSANVGGATLPANPVGFITINITGGDFKIPYYNV